MIIPKAPTPTKFDIDVALSFAGEDRPLVEEVAATLRAYGIVVFYDAYERNTLWGKDLYSHLDEVYRVRSRFCVMFLSRHYKKKLWTNHERESAQARAFEEQGEYILPVRLDQTEIKGIRPTLGYLDGSNMSATEIANEIAKKLGRDTDVQGLLEELRGWLVDYEIKQEGPQLRFFCEKEDYETQLSLAMLLEAYRYGQLNVFLMSSVFPQ